MNFIFLILFVFSFNVHAQAICPALANSETDLLHLARIQSQNAKKTKDFRKKS
jgi:hypothetical protein